MLKKRFKGREHKLTREDRIKGGRAKTKRKTAANQITALAQSKCKNCNKYIRLSCPSYEANIKKNGNNARCVIPETKKKILPIALDPDRLRTITLGKLASIDICAEPTDIKSQFLIFKSLMKFKRTYHPE